MLNASLISIQSGYAQRRNIPQGLFFVMLKPKSASIPSAKRISVGDPVLSS
jgi:hypothetical protein